MLSFKYGLEIGPLKGIYTQRHPHAGSQKHACPLPTGIKLALSCTIATVAISNVFCLKS